MKGMEKISEAVLSKVRIEAQNIIEDAEVRAQKEMAKAERQQAAKIDEEKVKILEKAEREAARILAQASIRARLELLEVKTSIISEITNRAKKLLSEIPVDESSLLSLTRETLDGLGASNVRIYVSAKDVSKAQEMVMADEELANRIAEIKAHDYLGGVIAEDVKARVRLDNTYEARLETLLPKMLPEIARKIF